MGRGGSDETGCAVVMFIIVIVANCIWFPPLAGLVAIAVVWFFIAAIFDKKKDNRSTSSQHAAVDSDPPKTDSSEAKDETPRSEATKVVDSEGSNCGQTESCFEIRGLTRTYGYGAERMVRGGEMLSLRRDAGNAYDSNAILACSEYGDELGYVAKEIAQTLAPKMDAGIHYRARVVPGSYSDSRYGKCLVELVEDCAEANDYAEPQTMSVECPECQTRLECPCGAGSRHLQCGNCGTRFVWRDSQYLRLLKCVYCGNDVEIGGVDEGAAAECPNCHYVCAVNKNPWCLEPYPWFERSAEAAAIREFARERGISKLVHFTSFVGLQGILETGSLMSRQAMNEYRRLHPESAACRCFRVNDEGRWDNRLECINTSIEKINTRLLWTMQNRPGAYDVGPWCILEINVAALEKQGVYFSVSNAASRYVRLHGTNSGLSGFKALFADAITSGVQGEGYVTNTYVVNRDCFRSRNRPTDDQAEVLIPGALPISLIPAVVFKTEEDRNYAIGVLGRRYNALHGLKVRVDEHAFEDRYVGFFR